MKITKKMEQALNNQINAELYSAYLYLAMSAYMEDNNWKGMAAWLKKQAGEEVGHAMKIFAYVYDRNGSVSLESIKKPSSGWKSPLQVFEQAYQHELSVTGMINNLMKVANSENDTATISYLKWFIDEQVEEESQALEIVNTLKLIKDAPAALLMLDHELANRK